VTQTRTAARRVVPVDVSDFKPNPGQRALLLSRAEQVLLAGGWGGGKTRGGAEAVLDLAAENEGLAGIVVSPTWQMLTRTTMVALRQAIPRPLIARERKSDRAIDLVNGSTIYYGSADNPGSLEGTNLAWAWLDEARLMSHEAYRIVTGRIRERAARRRQLVVTTTPQMGWLYDEFCRGLPERQLITASTRENAANLGAGYVEGLERALPKRLARAFIEGEFTLGTAAVYGEFDAARHVVDFTPSPVHETVLGIDFGVNSPSVIVAQVLAHDVWTPHATLPAGAIVIVDEVHPDQTPTRWLFKHVQAMPAAALARRAYVDPAGKGRDQASGMSSVDVLRSTLNVEPRYSEDPEERHIPNGVMLVQTALAPTAGPPMLYVARSVADREQRRGVMQVFRGYRYDERDGVQKSDIPVKDGVVDHAADALRYLVCGVIRDRRGGRSEILSRNLYGYAA